MSPDAESLIIDAVMPAFHVSIGWVMLGEHPGRELSFVVVGKLWQASDVLVEDVAPLSWWITNHVKDGRTALNFSECTQGGRGENDASETIR